MISPNDEFNFGLSLLHTCIYYRMDKKYIFKVLKNKIMVIIIHFEVIDKNSLSCPVQHIFARCVLLAVYILYACE